MNKTFLLLLALLPSLLFSEEYIKKEAPKGIEAGSQQIVNMNSEPSCYIDQMVNVISGDFNDFQTDLTIPGAEPIIFNRSYGSSFKKKGSLCTSWDINHYGVIEFSRITPSLDYANVYEDGRHPTIFSGEHHKKEPKSIHFVYGITNCSSGRISGATNVKNKKFYGNFESDALDFINSRGDIFKYTKAQKGNGKEFFRIKTGRFISGNQIDYRYNKDRSINRIKTIDQHRNPISRATFSYEKFKKSDIASTMKIISEDGRYVNYYFFKGKSRKKGHACQFLSKVERSDAPPEEYDYEKKGDHHKDRVIRKRFPDQRFFEIDYYGKGCFQVVDSYFRIKGSDDKSINRVATIKAPLGEDATPIVKYRFAYYPDKTDVNKNSGGKTVVYDALKNRTDYFYSSGARLTQIQKYTSGNSKPYSVEKLYWGTDENISNLMQRTFEDNKGNILFCRRFEYDHKGNINFDILEGNLTGTRSTTEYYLNTYTYTDDDRNLMTSQCNGKRKVVYEYLPNTNLLIKELTYEGTQLRSRKFYHYNHQSVLNKEVVDDGQSQDEDDMTGVTQRLITVKNIRGILPTGFPESEETRYWDPADGTEKLLKLNQYSYDRKGNITEKRVYDSERQLVSYEKFDYDSMGRLIKEVNPLGEVTYREYDNNGNQIKVIGPDTRFHLEYVYDFSNRLIAEKRVFSDGDSEIISYRYDYCGNKVAMVDPYGHETTYLYDEFGRNIKTVLPPIADENGNLIQPTLESNFDHMSFQTMKSDAKGNKEFATFTVRGTPISKTYSDGTQESYEYHVDGTIKTKTTSNGLRYEFKHDYLDRIVEEITYASTGEIVNSKRLEYNAFNLLREIDNCGVATEYTYYPHGKLKSKTRGTALETYEYDTLGRLWKKGQFYGNYPEDCTIEVKEYDIFDRVVEERVEDGVGIIYRKKNFTFDMHGKIVEEIYWDQSGQSITLTEYDAKQRPTRITDSEGNQTITVYHDRHKNKYGQNVLMSVITSPDGRTISKEHDILGKIQSITYRDFMNRILRSEEYVYDLNGNKIFFIQGDEKKKITSKWEYDSMNRVISQIESLGTPDQQVTYTSYNLLGQKDKVIKASGGIIEHLYDEKCRLKTIKSSDGSVHYDYTYDLNDNPIQIYDQINKTRTLKEYDFEGRMLRETLSNGLSLTYTYDRQGRPLSVTYPDNSKAVNVYDAAQLIRVIRYDSEGNERYRHEYTHFDLSGHCLNSKMIGNAGDMKIEYDSRGRVKKMETEVRKETIYYDTVGNVTDRVVRGKGEIAIDEIYTYEYDALRRLISENGPSAQNYKYDALHNRTSKNGNTYENNFLNQVISETGNKYKYDPNGNMIEIENKDGIEYYIYDAFDRLVTVMTKQCDIFYQYDELNRRVSKRTRSGEETTLVRYLYLGQNEVGSCNADGSVTQLRLLGLAKGAEIGGSIAIEIDDHVYAPIHDQQGNIVMLLDVETGAEADRYEYTAFGEERESGLKISPWRYSSKRVDEETSLVYFGRRYYAPWLGKWITPDPAGHEGGPNLYAYVDNAPLSNIDLYGLMPHNSYFQMFRNFMCRHSITCNAGGAIGYGLKFLGNQIVGFPQVRNVVSSLGHAIQTGRFVDYITEIRGECRSKKYEKFNEHANFKVSWYFGNGMMNLRDDFEETYGEFVKKILPYPIYAVFSSTHGFIADLIDTKLIQLGLKTHAVDLSVQQLRNCIASVGGVGNGGKVFAAVHSKGGAILGAALQHLTPEERKMIHVSTYGSATIISPEGLGSAINYVSSRDAIPYIADPVGLLTGTIKGYVQYLPGKGFPGADHAFKDTYQKTFEKYYDNQMDKYGT